VGEGKRYTLTCKLGQADLTAKWSWFRNDAEIADTSAEIKAKQENIITYTVRDFTAWAGTWGALVFLGVDEMCAGGINNVIIPHFIDQ
jgi:hypothetical protein